MNSQWFSPNDNRGVSPVIGVILMVAITVVLAAVIGTFVLGFGDSIQSSPQASFTDNHDTSEGELRIQLTGLSNADPSDLEVVVDGDATVSGSFERVGDTVTVSYTSGENQGMVNIIGSSNNGDEFVVKSYVFNYQ